MSGSVRREPFRAGCNEAPGKCLGMNAVGSFVHSVTLTCNCMRIKR